MADEPLATWQDVHDVTGEDYDTAEQARLGVELVRISRRIRRAAGWHLYPSVTEVITADGSGGRVQLLPTKYLTDLVELTHDGVTLDVATVDWSQAGYLERRDGGCWTRRPRGVAAKVTHGYADLEDVRGLVVDMALAAGFTRRLGGLKSLQTGPFSGSWETVELADDQLAVLAPYTLGG